MAVTDFVLPRYGSRSLADVVPAVAASWGLPGWTAPDDLPLPAAESWVVFLVDGMGAELVRRHAHLAPFLAGELVGQRDGTAAVPSTTVTSLTSLGTGLPPGLHGTVGFSVRDPGTQQLFNPLYWTPRLDPLEWQPHATVYERLTGQGVRVRAVTRTQFEGTGLTVATQRGAVPLPGDDTPQRLASTLQAVAAAGTGHALTYVYTSRLDGAGHTHGIDSDQWREALQSIDAEVRAMRAALPEEVRMLVVADHGMVDCPSERHVDVDAHPELRDGLTLFGGEARLRHLYVSDGALADVRDTWRGVLADRALVLTRDEAVGAGWFGHPCEVGDSAMLARVGDLLVAARGDHAVVSTRDFPGEAQLVGLHGSLSPAEMLVPFLVL